MRKTNKPVVINDGLSGNLQGISAPESILVGSRPWFEWLNGHEGFVYEGSTGHFTARSELRRGIRYWYAHRRRDGKLSKTYLGKSEELTLERLEQASATLAGEVSISLSLAGSPSEVSVAVATRSGVAQPAQYAPLTKFKPPALPQRLIARPRLTSSISAPAVLINAPSGFGKTTLVNEWRLASGFPVAWVTLNSDDNSPQQFWATLVMALRTIQPGFGQEWYSQLLFTNLPSPLTIITNLNNEIIRAADELDLPVLGLVIEDFHFIHRPEIHLAMQTWLDQIPARLQIIVTSNTKSPLALGNLRARGVVAEINTEDLRFNLEEGFDFLTHFTSGKAMAYSDMQALVKRTEGWAAGLVLAASIMAQQGQRARVKEVFTGAHVFLREFFMESILDQQTQEVRDFLLRTSILEHLYGPLCDVLTGRNDGNVTLYTLWQESLFLERMEKPEWYRYHEMFTEMLRIQLQEQFPAEITRLHRKAAKWYRKHAFLLEAIPHFLLGKSWEDAAVSIESVSSKELEQAGEDARLVRWIQQLPEEIVYRHQKLFILYVRLTRLVLPPQEAEDFLNRTEKKILALPVQERTPELKETLDRILRFRQLWAGQAPIVLGTQTSEQDDGVGQMLDGIVHAQRDSRFNPFKAEARAMQVYQTALAKNHLFSILVAGGTWANLMFSQGRLKRSEQIAQQVLQKANELTDRLPEPASIALTVLSGVKFEWNQISQAHQFLESAESVDPNPIRVDASINMAVLRAKIQSIQGDGEGALTTIETARDFNPHFPSNIWDDQDLAAYQALFRLHQGDLTAADKILNHDWEVDKYPFSAFVRASILVDQNRFVDAEEILRHLLERYPSSAYWMPMLRARVKLSYSLMGQQKINQARQAMADAARIAAPEFFVRPFLSTEPQIPMLLSLVLHTEDLNPVTKSFIQQLLSILSHMDGKPNSSGQISAGQLNIAASISPREQDILQSLSIGLSNREIAGKYFISESTVKTHLENIFRKLEVGNRMQAIAKAHALGLQETLAREI